MPTAVRNRFLLFLVSVIVVPFATVAIILFARGYRPDLHTREILPTGLLVANSYPDGAQVYVNGQLKSATDTTLNLPPGGYDITIKKEGFHSWVKHLRLSAEIVTRADAYLFPTIPSLKAITTTSVTNPILSPDGDRVLFTTKEASFSSRLMLLELNDSPLGFLNREARILLASPNVDFSTLKFIWSPDQRQLVALATPSSYLIDLNAPQLNPISGTQLQTLLTTWKNLQATRNQQKFLTLPLHLQNLLATASAQLVWSPNETKLLYVATASASIPDGLVRPLPGSSTQTQRRDLIPGYVYVYDLIEDRNFLIDSSHPVTPTPTPKTKTNLKPSPTPAVATPTSVSDTLTNLYPQPQGLHWFPTSLHLMKVESDQVSLVEYDGQNPTVIYAGPMVGTFAAPYPSAKQLLILTNLTPTPQNPALTPAPIQYNLYAVSLR